MATPIRERTKINVVMDDSCPAYEDLTAQHLRWVRAAGGATGSMTVRNPGAQGTVVYGVLLNSPAEGVTASIKVEGICECVANEAINAGTEVTVAGGNGRIEAAASGDFVCGVTREAALDTNHIISVTIKHYYMP